MFRTVLLAVMVSLLVVSASFGQQKPKIQITEPEDGAKVPRRPYVVGTVTDTEAEVWVVVHPMETSEYWVQPRPTVRDDGTWKTKIHIGRKGSVDKGKDFEIRAFANPTEDISEGKTSYWPKAEAKSEVIEVTRD